MIVSNSGDSSETLRDWKTVMDQFPGDSSQLVCIYASHIGAEKIENLERETSFFFWSSIPVRYILVLAKKPKTGGITLYSSKIPRGTSQNPLKVAQQLTFTMWPSNDVSDTREAPKHSQPPL